MRDFVKHFEEKLFDFTEQQKIEMKKKKLQREGSFWEEMYKHND